MPVSYIDQDYIDARIGAAARAALVSYLGNTITLTDIIADASEEVLGGLKAQGYQDPSEASPPALVQKFTLANVLDALYGKSGQEMPDTYLRDLGKFEAFLEGKIQIPDLALAGNAQEIGGVKFTNASKTDTDGQPPVFSDVRKYW